MLSKILKSFGYRLEKTAYDVYRSDNIQDPVFRELFDQCKPYTMTSIERMYALYQAVRHIARYNIEGCLVECGVWRGGSAMLMALTLLKYGKANRPLYLYDTYEGMSAPTDKDVTIRGANAADLLQREEKANTASGIWCYADLDDVRQNLARTGYPSELLHFVKGKVEDTLPAQMPTEPIALLRLDTDWYESTKHELEHLYPRLVANGPIIIDDYGHWQGCQKAVDEYFTNRPVLFSRVDYTSIMGVKVNDKC